LRVSWHDGLVQLSIQDDGRGFTPDRQRARRKRPGIGLSNIRERAAALGGLCKVESEARQGTTITVAFPNPRRG
jgi:signal transduction histidine kinase